MKILLAFALLLALSPSLSTQAAADHPEQIKVISHTPPLRYVRWTDPRENAFSSEVPSGWQISGGLFRYSPIDTRSAIQAVSPDGNIRVTMGDSEFSSFMVPNSMLNATGFPEGSRYPNSFGGYFPVTRYRTGTQFADQYVRSHVVGGCTGLDIVERRERPDLSKTLNRILATMPGMNMYMTTGEIHFTCMAAGQAMRGYYFAGTVSSQSGNGMAMWYVQHLYGYLAPAGKVATAQAALRQLVAKHRVDAQWAARQSRTTLAASQIMAQSNAEISKIISDSYWARARSLDRTSRNDANARRGTTDVADPNTGESWNIYGGHRYYWRVPGSDTIIGSDSPDPPGQNMVLLSEYP